MGRYRRREYILAEFATPSPALDACCAGARDAEDADRSPECPVATVMPTRFGVAVPTATEGMMYPVPFTDIEGALRIGLAAESLGFDSVWGNDHMSTQRYVREEFAEPPRFYDPISYLAYLAAVTEWIRLASCVLVLPFRHPVVVAKQAATLDLLSGGRFVLGVGIGAYREEFESMWPGRNLHRGEYVREFLESLSLLFGERRASYEGSWVSFSDVESYPKPLQDPLPILSGGNSIQARQRAATLAHGWLPACLTPSEYQTGLAEIRQAADDQGRELTEAFEPALQLAVCVAPTQREAKARFESSQVFSHLVSLSRSTLRDQVGENMARRNLVGTPDAVTEQIGEYQKAGVRTFAGLLFVADTVDEFLDGMAYFSQELMNHFAPSRAGGEAPGTYGGPGHG